MNLTFSNQTALVTGAGRGIGREIALNLAAQGVTVICVSKSDSCKKVANEIVAAGGKAEGIPCDVSDSAAVNAAAEELLKKYETIDILVNNAGITRDMLLMRMSEEDWDAVIQTNLSSCFYWTKAIIRPMTRKRNGRIVNISSVSGLIGNPGQANYSAAKAGMVGMTKALAREFAGRSITVNAVAPGFIETDMTTGMEEDVIKRIVPLKRFGKPEDIATMTTFLCSDEASYITGQVFSVDGGMAM